jgi:hypothetical protein
MLNQPMMDKLLAMRLHGMVEALKAQEQDRVVGELSFLERLALLVDQQWSWRENQALARRLKAAKLKGSACVEDIDYRAARDLDKTVMRALAKDSAWVAQPREHFRNRAVRRGQELPRSGAGPESLSGWLLSTLSARGCLVARTGPGSRRWQPTPLPRTTRSHRCPGHR